MPQVWRLRQTSKLSFGDVDQIIRQFFKQAVKQRGGAGDPHLITEGKGEIETSARIEGQGVTVTLT